jgi:putative ABC transport system permease protein
MFVGIMQSFTVTIDKSRAELIIMPPKAMASGGPGGGAGPLPKRVVPLVYRHPAVVEVQDLPDDFGRFIGPGQASPSLVNIMIIDTSPNGVTFSGLKKMESLGFRNLVTETILAAKARSAEMAKDG